MKSATELGARLPRWLRKTVLHFEVSMEDAVAQFANSLPAGARLLDAGAGECRYARAFVKQRYTAVDLGVGDEQWNYGRLDALADLSALPFRAGCFGAAVNLVTIEHLKDPATSLREIARVLAPGAPLLLVAPHEWEEHQTPHDYFRFTRYGLSYLLTQAGFEDVSIRPVGGYFRLLSRRLLNGLQFFMGGWRWILFLPAATLLVPPALFLPLLDLLDDKRNFTLGFICHAKRSSA